MKKSRIVKTSIALLAVILALGFVGCGGKGGGGSTGSTEDNDATLSMIRIFGIDVPKEDWGTPDAQYENIINGKIGSAVRDNTSGSVTTERTNPEATVRYARVEGNGALDVSKMITTPNATVSYTGANAFNPSGDFLAIEVTSANGKNKLYYRIAIISDTVAVNSVLIGSETAQLPTAAAAKWEDALELTFLSNDFTTESIPANFKITVDARDKLNASIEYARVEKGSSVAPVFSTNDTLALQDGDYLYIKISNNNAGRDKVAFYKWLISFKMETIVKYGSPVIGDKHIDTLWNSVPALKIEREFKGDAKQEWYDKVEQGIITYGEAKVLWDEFGLYLYVKVYDPELSGNPNQGLATHEYDSVELFINEAYPLNQGVNQYSAGGSQYRLDIFGRSSGHPAACGTEFNNLDKKSAWTFDEGGGKTGYYTIFQAPWRFHGPSNPMIADQRQFGLEIQVNAAPVAGPRYATLVWNNNAETNYDRTQKYGLARLDADGNEIIVPTEKPNITTQPLSDVYGYGENVSLKVVAATPADGGTLSYQWYKAAKNDEAGSTIVGAEAATYSFTTASANETSYYYVVVTNKKTGFRDNTRKSAYAEIKVTNIAQVEKLELSQSCAIYEFVLPGDTTWADYTGLNFDLYIPSWELAKTADTRWHRIFAGFPAPAANTGYDTLTGGKLNVSAFNNNSGDYIVYQGKGNNSPLVEQYATLEADGWHTLTHTFNGTGSSRPPGISTGPVYIGLGVAAPIGSVFTTYVKNITLVHKDDVGKNVVSKTDGAGNKSFGIMGGNSEQNATKRSWVDDPTITPLDKPDIPDLPEKAKADYIHTTGMPLINSSPVSTEWAAVVTIDLGAIDARAYESFTIELEYQDGSNIAVTTANGFGDYAFYSSSTKVGGDNYNLGMATGKINIANAVLTYADGPINRFVIRASSTWVANNLRFVKVTAFTLHAPAS